MYATDLKVALMKMAVEAASAVMAKVDVKLNVDQATSGSLTDPGVMAYNVMFCREVEVFYAFLEACEQLKTGMWADPVGDTLPPVSGANGVATLVSGLLAAVGGLPAGTTLTSDVLSKVLSTLVKGGTPTAQPIPPVAPPVSAPPKPTV